MAYPMVLHEPIIVSLAVSGERAPADAPDVASLIATGFPVRGPASALEAEVTECELKAVGLAIEVVLFVVNLASAGTTAWAGSLLARAKSSLVTRLSPAVISMLVAQARVLAAAYNDRNAQDMAGAVVAIFKELWSADFVKVTLDAIKAEMSWWDWVTTGVTITACLTLWLASGGAVLVAQVALTVLSAVELYRSATAVVSVCGAGVAPAGLNLTNVTNLTNLTAAM